MATQVTELNNKQRAARTPSRLAASSRGGRRAAETMRQQQGNKSLAEMSTGEVQRRLTLDMQNDPALKAKYKAYIADHEYMLAIAESV